MPGAIVIPILVGAAVVAVNAVLLGRARRRNDARAGALARALSMELVPADAFGNGAGFSGQLEGAQVDAAFRGAELFVEITTMLPPDLRVLFPPRELPLEASVRELKILFSGATGDAEFDSNIFVDGAPATIASVMDAETRRSIREICDVARIHLESGRFALLVTRAEGAEVVIRAAVALARRLGSAAVSPQTLASRARTESLPRLREQALEALVAAFPDSPESRAVAAVFARSGERRTALLAKLMDPGSMTALLAAPRETADALATLPPEAARAGLRLLTRNRAGAEPLLVEVLEAAARAGSGARALEIEAA
ncbi:MAG TPA: hypothetical protein VMV18_02540, partial [bacterium]|nr:hypothetical protein [bacterium]